MRSKWLYHPESPGVKVLVCRTTLGWWVKPRHFATLKEVDFYHHYCQSNHRSCP